MRGLVIVKNGVDINKVNNVKGFIEMNIRRLVDKLDYLPIYGVPSMATFSVDTSRKNFDFIKEQLEELYPGECVFVEPKKRSELWKWNRRV